MTPCYVQRFRIHKTQIVNVVCSVYMVESFTQLIVIVDFGTLLSLDFKLYTLFRYNLFLRKEKLRSEEPEEEGSEVQCNSDENLRVALTQQVISWVLPDLANCSLPDPFSRETVNLYQGETCLAGFVDKFLLECNTSSVRWQAHTLSVALYSQAGPQEKARILEVLWSLWHKVNLYILYFLMHLIVNVFK